VFGEERDCVRLVLGRSGVSLCFGGCSCWSAVEMDCEDERFMNLGEMMPRTMIGVGVLFVW